MAPAPMRIFFAADIHGSQITFRKFLAAAAFYGVDALVFGGDLMGKALVPILRTNGEFRASFQGRDEEFDADGLGAFTDALEQPGFYWKVFDREEYEAVEGDPMAKHGLFHELASERLAGWIERAEEALRGTDVRLYLTGGNDDEPAVLETLERHDGDHVIASEGAPRRAGRRAHDDHGRPVHLHAVGHAAGGQRGRDRRGRSRRPWRRCPTSGAACSTSTARRRTPRSTRASSSRCGRASFPSRSGEGGRFVTTGGGSVAVREAIERYQPLVGLHGHIHESGGRFRIGRTQTFNPGSEYVQGVLQGVIVSLRGGRLVSYQHTQG